MWPKCYSVRNLIFPGHYKLCNNQLQPKAYQNRELWFYLHHNKSINMPVRCCFVMWMIFQLTVSPRVNIVDHHTFIRYQFDSRIFIVSGHSPLMLLWRLTGTLVERDFFVWFSVFYCSHTPSLCHLNCLFVSDFRFSDSTFTFTYIKGHKR